MIDIIILALAAAAISMTLTKSSAFRWLRKLAAKMGETLGEMAGCPYCVSHWVALALVLLYGPVLTGCPPIDVLVCMFAVVALAAPACWLIWASFAKMGE